MVTCSSHLRARMAMNSEVVTSPQKTDWKKGRPIPRFHDEGPCRNTSRVQYRKTKRKTWEMRVASTVSNAEAILHLCSVDGVVCSIRDCYTILLGCLNVDRGRERKVQNKKCKKAPSGELKNQTGNCTKYIPLTLIPDGLQFTSHLPASLQCK